MSDNLPAVVQSIDTLAEGVRLAETDEEIVSLTQRCVYLKDTAGSLINFAIGDLANKYAPPAEGGQAWAASYQNRTKEEGWRRERLTELAEKVGLKPETIDIYASVARKFHAPRRLGGVSWSVYQSLAGAEDPVEALDSVLTELPNPTMRQAREYLASRKNMRDQAASAAGLGRGGRSTYKFDDGSLDEEIVAARRRDGREVVRLAEQATGEAVEVIMPPTPQPESYIPTGYGNWIEQDLIDTAQELVDAFFHMNPSPRTTAKVKTLVARILEAG